MKLRVLDKKHLTIIIISIFAVIISYFNITYAFFSTSENKNISVKSAASFGERIVIDPNVVLEGNLIYKSTDDKQNVLKNQTLSYTKDNVDEYDYELTIATQVDPHITEYEGNEYTRISYEIYHKTDTSIDTTNFVCNSNKYNNGTSEDTCNTGTFIENSLNGLPFELINNYKITDTNTHYFDVYIYLNNETESKMFKTKIFYLEKEVQKENKEKTLEEVKEFISNNEPDLNTGLIPVVYDDTKGNDTHWFVADITKAWYDYESQWWANAVSVDSTTEGVRSKYVNSDGTYNEGTEIATNDMLAMFVWIPRYSYTIGCHEENTCLGYKVEGASDLTTFTPGAIDIKFVSTQTKENPGINNGTYPTYTYTSVNTRQSEINNWYTHPAFIFGSKQLLGIWIGKFETSVNLSSTCYNNIINKNGSASSNCVASNDDVTPRILPNVLSLTYQNIYNQFETAKKITNNTIYGITGDSHMTKNSEWGAVAYLSQSIYGKYGNNKFKEKNKEIYKNNSGITTTNIYQDRIYYNGYTGRSEGIFINENSTFSDNGSYTYDGISNIDNVENCLECGTGASTTGNIYGIYDMSGGANENVMGWYTQAEYDGHESGFSTDTIPATKYYNGYRELDIFVKTKEVIAHATAETYNWYNDNYCSLTSSNFWVSRGMDYNGSNSTGVFSVQCSNGSANNKYSFRISLVTT